MFGSHWRPKVVGPLSSAVVSQRIDSSVGLQQDVGSMVAVTIGVWLSRQLAASGRTVWRRHAGRFLCPLARAPQAPQFLGRVDGGRDDLVAASRLTALSHWRIACTRGALVAVSVVLGQEFP